VTLTSAVRIPVPQFLEMNKDKLTGKQILAVDEESSRRRFPQTNLAT
jgi:hypothetical protein